MRNYVLEREQWVDAPLEQIFEFFSDAANLERLTPPWMGFRIRSALPIEMKTGAEIRYRIRLGGVPVGWITRITEWNPPRGFMDVQERGPYTLWEHTHTFRPLGNGVLMTDRVRYLLPFGPLGRIAHALLVRALLGRIFDYRFEQVRRIFGERND